MYKIYNFEDKNNLLLESVKKMDWKRGLPGGWLTYGPPRQVTGYGDGSLYKDSGKRYGKYWKYTAWSASVPYTNTTAVVETVPLPKDFVETGIIREMRRALKDYGAEVDDSTGTGIWCNYYSSDEDYISPHRDNENYYQRNFQGEPLFVSLTLFEDGSSTSEKLARFQIKKTDSWETVELKHLTMLVMSGDVEHRVLKPKINSFRPRYNITFRTPVKRTNDIIKNFRFFSNFGRYYRKTYLLYVPKIVFPKEKPELGEKLKYYRDENKAVSENGKVFPTISDNSNYEKVLKGHSLFGPIFLSLNTEVDRKKLVQKIGGSNPPGTTTNQSLLVLLRSC